MSRKIILYSAQMCSDCQKLKAYMDGQGIEYELRDVRENEAYAGQVEEHTGKLGVPYLVLDGKWVCGYDGAEPFTDKFAEGLFDGL